MNRCRSGRCPKALLLAVSLLLWGLLGQQTVALPQKTENGDGRKVENGREIFNGKGVCHYCHGIDGYRDKLPPVASDTAALIAQLNPPPTDLRNAKMLRLKSDTARARAIVNGHAGTGMFPTTTLTRRELTETLSYLAAIRKEGHAQAE